MLPTAANPLMIRKSGEGFTLIEIMITLSIAAILLGIAAPSFQSFISGQRVKTAAFDIAYTLNLARSEAIKRNAAVVITPVSGTWKDGWTVTAGATTLSRQDAYPNLIFTGPATNLTYGPNGRITGSSNIAFEISTSPASRCGTITVQLSGVPNSHVVRC